MSDPNEGRRTSKRPSKRKVPNNEPLENGKKIRSCEKVGCFVSQPTCILLTCDLCSVSGYTSRWYHMSLGEHFCNNCFDSIYRPGKTRNTHFNQWSNNWAHAARASKPTLKRFVASELLPYWIKCTRRQCGKWRMVRKEEVIDLKFIKNFECPDTCLKPEDSDVSLVLDPNFMSLVSEEPLLKNSPAAPYLKRFLPEDVGVCPIDNQKSFKEGNVLPFLVQQCGESPIWVKPDEINCDEEKFADQVLISRATYLGLRNFLVALWNLNPSVWLSFEKINENLICRGLVRIYLISVAERVLDLLTKQSVVNFGIIQNPNLKNLEKSKDPGVLVIGAGVAGLAAASHLQNLGVNVHIYEAEPELGGRVKDIPCLGSGAFFIQGLKNNPFTILAIQAKAEYQMLTEDTVLFRSNGKIVPKNIINKSQHELNGLLQGAIESTIENKADVNCYQFIKSARDEMKQMTAFCKDPDVFDNILSQTEIEMKADTKNLSLLNWEFPIALKGNTGFICNGLRLFLIKLSRCIDISYNQEVKSIDYCGDKVKVTTSSDTSIFSKVLITVPQTVLQKGNIEFTPVLPDFKKTAIEGLGNFYCEKLILEFSKNFWSKAVKGRFSKFSVISNEQIFEVFIDMTSSKADSIPTLVTFISQKSFNLIDGLSNKEVVDKCVSLLKGVFPRVKFELTKWHLTDWRNGKIPGTYGSYPKKGSNADIYDYMAKCIDNKLYFAGEATFRNSPSSVTGAYLSGLRESAKIMKDLELC